MNGSLGTEFHRLRLLEGRPDSRDIRFDGSKEKSEDCLRLLFKEFQRNVKHGFVNELVRQWSMAMVFIDYLQEILLSEYDSFSRSWKIRRQKLPDGAIPLLNTLQKIDRSSDKLCSVLCSL